MSRLQRLFEVGIFFFGTVAVLNAIALLLSGMEIDSTLSFDGILQIIATILIAVFIYRHENRPPKFTSEMLTRKDGSSLKIYLRVRMQNDVPLNTGDISCHIITFQDNAPYYFTGDGIRLDNGSIPWISDQERLCKNVMRFKPATVVGRDTEHVLAIEPSIAGNSAVAFREKCLVIQIYYRSRMHDVFVLTPDLKWMRYDPSDLPVN